MIDAERAYTDLKGKSLPLAIRFFVENYREDVSAKPLREAYEEFIAAKSAANRRAATLINLKSRVGYLVRAYQGKNVHEITPQNIATCVHRHELKSAGRRDNERRPYPSFFSWRSAKGMSVSTQWSLWTWSNQNGMHR